MSKKGQMCDSTTLTPPLCDLSFPALNALCTYQPVVETSSGVEEEWVPLSCNHNEEQGDVCCHKSVLYSTMVVLLMSFRNTFVVSHHQKLFGGG